MQPFIRSNSAPGCQRELRKRVWELRGCLPRLGTTDERPSDFDRALVLAQEISNHLTAASLPAAVLKESTHTLVEFHRRLAGENE